jgi:tetratricopeptide (TPR) repeat protein
MFLNPTGEEVHRVAAQALLALGHRSQARLEYALAFRTASERNDVLAEAARAFPAVEDLLALVEGSDDEVRVEAFLRQAGRVEDALVAARAWRAHAPREVARMERHVQAALLAGRFDEGLGAARELTEAHPYVHVGPMLMGDVLRPMRRLDEADEAYRLAWRRNVGNRDVAYRRTRLALDRGDPIGALTALSAVPGYAGGTARSRAEYHHLRGEILRAQGDVKAAATHYEQAFALAPQEEIFALGAARSRADRGALQEAVALLTTFVAAQPGRRVPSASRLLAELTARGAAP